MTALVGLRLEDPLIVVLDVMLRAQEDADVAGEPELAVVVFPRQIP